MRSSSNGGGSSSSSALPGTTGSPPAPSKRCRGHCSRSGPPIGVIHGLSRIRRISTPPPLELKDCLCLLDGEGGEDVPTFGQLLLLGVGLEARVVSATKDMVDDIFSPPEVETGPPMCTHHPLFLSRSAHDISPVIVHAGGILMWNGAYDMEVVKGDSTDRDVEVTWALGDILPPSRAAPARQLLHAEPAWKRATESKKGTWTVTCAFECEVCIVFYPVFARSSRHCAAHSQMLHIRSGMQIHKFCANFARSSREFGMNSYTFPFHFILKSNGTAGCPVPVRSCTPTSKLRAILCKCANNSADYCLEIYANFARIYSIFVFNAGSQRMGCLFKFFVVRCLPMSLTLSHFLDIAN